MYDNVNDTVAERLRKRAGEPAFARVSLLLFQAADEIEQLQEQKKEYFAHVDEVEADNDRLTDEIERLRRDVAWHEAEENRLKKLLLHGGADKPPPEPSVPFKWG